MISGANDKELTIANARADIILKLDNTSTYESWLIIDTYIEQLEQALNEIREYINIEIPLGITWGEDILQIIDKVLGDEK